MANHSLVYSMVARGPTVLAEYSAFRGTFSTIAKDYVMNNYCSDHRISFTSHGHTFNFLAEEGFTYAVVANEDIGEAILFSFLESVKRDFWRCFANGEAESALSKSLNLEFGPKLKDHMVYVAMKVELEQGNNARDAEIARLRTDLLTLKRDVNSDALIWGATHVTLVAGEMLKRHLSSFYSVSSQEIWRPKPWYLNLVRQRSQPVLELAMQASTTTLDSSYIVTTPLEFAYVADIVIARRDARAHLVDPEVQVESLLDSQYGFSTPQQCPPSPVSAPLVSPLVSRYDTCLELFERHPDLLVACKFEWFVLKNHALFQ